MSLEFRLKDWQRAETGWMLSYLDRYLDVMEASLQETAQLEQSTLQLDRDENGGKGEWDHRWREHCLCFMDDFPTKLRYSFIILLYSYLESRTQSFCTQVLARHLIKTPFNPSAKGHKSYLAELRKYFELYHPLATSVSSLWQPFLDFEQLRHCLVHKNGIITDAKCPSEIAAIIRRTSGLSRGDDREIRIDLAYCKTLIAKLRNFFDTCFDAAGFYPKHDYFPEVPRAYPR
jgi:hypothetical protein